MSACGGLIKPINGKKPYSARVTASKNSLKWKKAIYGFFRLGLPYSFFRVALCKSSHIYRISFRIKLGFIRIT